MARAAPSRTTPDATIADATALVDGWMQSQQRLLAVSMDQWSGLQELWLRSWRQQLDAWTELWRADGTAPTAGGPAAFSGMPANYMEAIQRASQAWWGPWEPLFQRGGEQLG
jgi:hypothetical protein